MIFENLPDPLMVFNIGLNFIEFAIEILVFLFFLSAARRSRTEKGVHGGLSVRFGLSYLFFAMARFFFIIWDYIVFDSLFRAFAWIFNILAILFVIFVFFRVFDKYLPKLKLYIAIALPIGIFLFIIYSYFTFIQYNIIINLIFTAFFCLILFPPIYAFAKIIIKKGTEVRKYIIAVMFGLIFLVSGQIIASLHRYINVDYSKTIKITGHLIFLLGVIFFALGFWGIPSLKEFQWKERIKHLYIIKEGGINIYDHAFKMEKTVESDLIAGSIAGISDLIQELTKSKEKIEVIKQKDLKILLKYGKYVTTALIADDDLEILHIKLKTLTNEFETLFQYVLPDWTGDLEVFSPVRVMVERIFK